MPNANITVKDVLKQLDASGDEKVRAHNTKWGAGEHVAYKSSVAMSRMRAESSRG